MCLPSEPPAPQRARERVGSVPVVAPLVGVRVPVRRARHLPRRARPVGGHRHRRPPGDRAALLLPDVVRPPAAVAAHRPGEQQQREHRAVGGVAVEPLADPGTHDDHGPAVRIDRVRRELARHPDRLGRRHSRDRLLPRRRVGGIGVGRSRSATRRASPGRPPRTGPAPGRTPCTPAARRPRTPARPASAPCHRRRPCRTPAGRPPATPRDPPPSATERCYPGPDSSGSTPPRRSGTRANPPAPRPARSPRRAPPA